MVVAEVPVHDGDRRVRPRGAAAHLVRREDAEEVRAEGPLVDETEVALAGDNDGILCSVRTSRAPAASWMRAETFIASRIASACVSPSG